MKLSFKTALFTLLFVSNSFVHSQGSTKSVGFEGAFSVPVGKFASSNLGNAGFGLGGTVNGGFMVLDRLKLGVEVAYHNFGENRETSRKSSRTMIPILLTYSYYFNNTSSMKPYGFFGLGFVSEKFTQKTPSTLTASFTPFTVVLGFGVESNVADKTQLDFALKFNLVVSDKSYLDFGYTAGPIKYNSNYLSLGMGVKFRL